MGSRWLELEMHTKFWPESLEGRTPCRKPVVTWRMILKCTLKLGWMMKAGFYLYVACGSGYVPVVGRREDGDVSSTSIKGRFPTFFISTTWFVDERSNSGGWSHRPRPSARRPTTGTQWRASVYVSALAFVETPSFCLLNRFRIATEK